MTDHPIKAPRKLIEVALPLDAINEAAAREKSIRHGHPSTLHLWWARRPLAAARAVIFGQMVNDPSWKWEMEHPGEVPPSHLKASWAASRKRLFTILEELVKWESTNDGGVLERARAEIRKSWIETCELNQNHPRAADLFDPNTIPPLQDPFAGGGAIPLEGQRLGLEARASDLNPVAVLINKAMIEIPPIFADMPPVNPDWQELPAGEKALRQWRGSEGLGDDVRFYGRWIRDEAERRIGHLYPEVEVTSDMIEERPDLKPLVGQQLTVVAWLWARTVKSPNPAYRNVDVPLVSSFVLCPMTGKEAYVEPVIEGGAYRFVVKVGKPPVAARNGTKLSRGANFRCVMSGSPIGEDHIRSEFNAGRGGQRLMAIVAEGVRSRIYLTPTPEQEAAAQVSRPDWRPELELPDNPRWFSPPLYGLKRYGDLFTSRQLTALSLFSDLVAEVRTRIVSDAAAAGLVADGKPLSVFGRGATAYADCVSVYLGFLVSKLADKGSTLCTWDSGPTSARTASGRSARVATVRVTFSRQALPMTWDFAEVNFFSDSVGSTETVLKTLTVPLNYLSTGVRPGMVSQRDAARGSLDCAPSVVSTDPPYYDNIGYADLSDFFYTWLRRTLKPVFPDLFATIATPKTEELIATPYRHGTKAKAEQFFLDGMTMVMHRFAVEAHPAFPVTIYYAFKQSESEVEGGTTSTGWETFLRAIIRAGFSLTGTWPMRTELGSRIVGSGTNALASSIVLVCRQRHEQAERSSRRSFVRELNAILPEALDQMTRGTSDERSPVAPVDLSQAIIGPGMAVFSKYAAVLEADGTPMTVKTALTLINRFLAEDDFDHDTQFCLHWFEQHGWKDGKFGEADTLARAKGTSVEGVKRAGVLYATAGIVRLLKWTEYEAEWDAARDERLPVWEVLHQLIRVLRTDGESGAGTVLSKVQVRAEATRQLAYRLYTLCERAGWAEDARAYNEIITSWSAIESAAARVPGPKQGALFEA